MSIYDQVKELAEQHSQDIGAVVMSLADWLEMYEAFPAEEKQPGPDGITYFTYITIAGAPVVQRDEHEGPPRWAPEHECKSWFAVVPK